MTYNVFGGTLNPTLLLSTSAYCDVDHRQVSTSACCDVDRNLPASIGLQRWAMPCLVDGFWSFDKSLRMCRFVRFVVSHHNKP